MSKKKIPVPKDYIVQLGQEVFNFGPCDESMRRFIHSHLERDLVSFKKTDDEWFQPFPNNYVAVYLISRRGRMHEKDVHGVYVTGVDDAAMECVTSGRGEAKRLLNRLPEVLSQQVLLNLGFTSC